MTKLARAAVPPPTGPGQVEVLRQTVPGGKGLQTTPEGALQAALRAPRASEYL